MKKLFIIFLVLFLANYFLVEANAAQIFNVDFSQGEQKGYILRDGDGISFSFSRKEYVISVDEIGKTSVRLKSFIYKENGERETFYLPLNKGVSYKLDFDKDDVYDMKVSLLEVDEKATILFETIQEPKNIINPNKISGGATADNFKINVKGVIISALIIIGGLVAYFTFKK